MGRSTTAREVPIASTLSLGVFSVLAHGCFRPAFACRGFRPYRVKSSPAGAREASADAGIHGLFRSIWKREEEPVVRGRVREQFHRVIETSARFASHSIRDSESAGSRLGGGSEENYCGPEGGKLRIMDGTCDRVHQRFHGTESVLVGGHSRILSGLFVWWCPDG